MTSADPEDFEREETAREIERAFADVPRPGDDQLVGAPIRGDSAKVLEAFRGKHWKSVPLDVLFIHRADLGFFTPEAFRFYLPAYLVAAVLHAHELDTLRENVFYMLTPPVGNEALQDRFARRIELLDAAQRAAIRRFVEQYVQTETSYPDPLRERALEFWRSAEPRG